MHGTGTSLGDPIEIGALAALLGGAPKQPDASRLPLVLMAGKSLIGHSEPAAGVMGFAHAQMAVALRCSMPIMHLSEINHYISPVMRPGMFSVARQPGVAGGRHAALVTGVSSFAFQGTNAHSLVKSAPADAGLPRPTGAAWRRGRTWVLPPMFDLMRLVQAAQQLAVFELPLDRPRAACLRQVVLQGQPVLSLGMLAEVVAEADAQLNQTGAHATLGGVAAAPTPLGPAAQPAVLRCALRSGAFEVALASTTAYIPCASGTVGMQRAAQPAEALRPSSAGSFGHWLVRQAVVAPLLGPQGLAEVTSDQRSMPNAVALGPALAESALQLCGTRLATAVQVVAVSAAPPAGTAVFASAASKDGGYSTALQLGGSTAAQLHGVTFADSARVAPMVMPHGMQLSATPEVEEGVQPSGIVYEVCWAASSPHRAAPGAPGPRGPVVGAPAGSTVVDALAFVQSSVQHCQSVSLAIQPSALLDSVPTPAPRAAALAGAALQGILKVVAQEFPALAVGVAHGGLPAGTAWQAALSTSGSAAGTDVHGTGLAMGVHFAPRLLPSLQAEGTQQTSMLSGNHLITGGSGTLGGCVALWLAQQGAQSVILASRSGGAGVVALQQLPTELLVVATKADAGLQADVAGLSLHSFQTVFHAGGVLADATIANQTIQGIRTVSMGTATHGWLTCTLPHIARHLTSCPFTAAAGAGSQAVGCHQRPAPGGNATSGAADLLLLRGGLLGLTRAGQLQCCQFRAGRYGAAAPATGGTQSCWTAPHPDNSSRIWPLGRPPNGMPWLARRARTPPACNGEPGPAPAWRPRRPRLPCASSAWAWLSSALRLAWTPCAPR
jgi:hypothetical protein